MTREELFKKTVAEGWREPCTLEAAKALGFPWYYAHDKRSSLPIICENGVHLLRRSVTSGRCIDCAGDGHQERAGARREGQSTYMADCAACGTATAHSVAHGKCLTCFTTGGVVRKKSPRPHNPARTEARRLGITRYKAPCAACGCEREHSVVSGKCLVCYTTTGAKRSRKHAPRYSALSAIMRECPDLVLPRREAMAQGWTVFRTGEPCPKGHRGWRYVNNSQCVECQNKRGA